MIRRFGIVLFLLLIWLWRANGQTIDKAANSDRRIGVSLVRLITSPELYNGRLIKVTGYYDRGFEQSALFLSKESAAMHDLESSIWLDLDDTNTSKRIVPRRGYASVEGIFYSNPERGVGHLGLWRGKLANIVELQPMKGVDNLEIGSPQAILSYISIIVSVGVFIVFRKRLKANNTM